MTECCRRAIAMALVLLLASCESDAGSEPGAAKEPAEFQLLTQFKLPKGLREISGLAVIGPNQLIAVADEQALIFAIDLDSERAEAEFSIGKPPKAGDFEGIEAVGGRTVLTDSDGVLIWAQDDQIETWNTGLGRRWEIEGLARDPQSELYYLAAKGGRGTASDQTPILIALDLDQRQFVPSANIQPDYEAVQDELERKRISPSGLAFDQEGEALWIVAAREQVLMQFSRTGELMRAVSLKALADHRQPEGIALFADGRLTIADEGKKRGRLTVYRYDF